VITKKNGAPTTMAPLRLTALNVYPIKSAAGISTTAWEVDGFGLEHDRRWMVVDETGRFLTQRTHPRLALVRPTFQDQQLIVEAPDMPPLDLPIRPRATVKTEVVVWNDTCDALWLGRHPGDWFSQVLGCPCSLVYLPDETVRPANPAFAPAGVRVSFADAFPFLLISEESLADLNSRLSTPLPMNRFRPNLVIAGGEPYVEDSLARFEIASISFQVVKPCDRCAIPMTDQTTTVRGPEPLRTLATYRKREGEVFFGQNVIHFGTGRLATGAILRLSQAPLGQD
jgi:uncharacterized protein YcbX